jgi:hypothetical protein
VSDEVTGQNLLDDAFDGGFEQPELVEPGKYRLELDANPTKKDSVFVKGRIIGGPYEGKLVSGGLQNFGEQHKPGARSIAAQNVKGMGISREDCKAIYAAVGGNWAEFVKVLASWIKGRIVDAELVYNDYNNETRMQFDIGKITLVSAPPQPGYGTGVPQAAPPAPQAGGAAAAAPAVAEPVAPAPAAAEPVAPAVPTTDDPGF